MRTDDTGRNRRNGKPNTTPNDLKKRFYGTRADSDHDETDDGSRCPPHDVPTWPGDSGLVPPALALADPDEQRREAVTLGQTTRAVSQKDLEEHGGFEGFYGPPSEIRVNAVHAQTERMIAQPKKVHDTTKTRIAVEKAEGERAQAEAQRLERGTPRLEKEEIESKAALDRVETQAEVRQEEREQYLDAVVLVEPDPLPAEPEPTPTPAEQAGLTGPKLSVLMVTEILLALLGLVSSISGVVPTTFPFEAELIAGGIAVTVQFSAFAVGRLIVVVELPQRLTAFFFVGSFGFSAANFIPAINLLRQGSIQGITALTWVSVMVATIAAATGWASGLKKQFERRLATYRTKPEAAARRVQEKACYRQARIDRATEGVRDAKERLEEAKATLKQHRETIAALWAIVEGTPGRTTAEQLAGDEAKAEIATETAICETMVNSEEQHRDWLAIIAWLTRLKCRSEVLPDTHFHVAAAAKVSADRPIPVTIFAAILALAVGSVTGAAANSLLALASGSGLAAVLFGLSLRPPRMTAPTPAAATPNTAATYPLDEDSPRRRWKWQPDHVQPRGGGVTDSNTDDIA